MKRLKITFLGLALFSLVAPRGATQDAAPASTDGAVASEIKLTAKKYQFDPSTITVKKGDHVKLVVTALDHDHGFKLDAFNINQKLKKGEATTIEFTADKTGTFPFQCSHFCGMGHGKMKGQVVVQE